MSKVTAMLRACSLLLCLVSTQAWSQPVIPAMCLPYLDQLQAVIKSPSTKLTDVLDEGFVSGRSYRYDRIVGSLNEQWKELNQSFSLSNKPLSENQRYLRQCLNDPTKCHGYIVQNIKQYTPLYCSHKILHQAFMDAQTDIPQRVLQCTTLKDQFFEAPHMQNPKFIHACLNKDTMEYKNFEGEYDYLNKWNQAYQQNLLTAAKNAPDQNVFYYMYQKVIHEADQHVEMTETIAKTIGREKFQQQIRSCSLTQRSNRLDKSYGIAQQAFSKNYIFKPEEVSSPAYVKELNIRFLEDKFANRAPEDFSKDELLEWMIFRMPSMAVTVEDTSERMDLLREYKNNEYFYSEHALYEKKYLPDFEWEKLRISVDPAPSDTYAHLQQVPLRLQQIDDAQRAAKRDLRNLPTQDSLIEEVRNDQVLFKQIQEDSKQGYQQSLENKRPQLSQSPTLAYKKFYQGTYPKVVINIAMAYFLQHLFQETLQGKSTKFTSFENFKMKYSEVICTEFSALCEAAWFESYDQDFQNHYQRLSAISFDTQQMDIELADIEKKIFAVNDYCYQHGKNAQEMLTLTEQEKQMVRTKLEMLTQPVFAHPYFQSIMSSENALKWLGLHGNDPVQKCLTSGVLFGAIRYTQEVEGYYRMMTNRAVYIPISSLPKYKNSRPKEVSQQPAFQVKRETLIDLNGKIAQTLTNKLKELEGSFPLYQMAASPKRMPENHIETLIEEFHSLLEHYPLPVLEYFQDKQTFENGYFLCEIFIHMRDDIAQDERRMELFETSLIAVSFLAIPATMGLSSWLALSARTMVAVNAYVYGGLSLAYGGLNLYELVRLYDLKEDATVSFATGHMSSMEASEFYQQLQKQINSAWLQASIGSILFFSIEAPFIYRGGKRFARQILDKEFRGVQKRRMGELEDIRKAQDPEQMGHMFDRPKVFDFVTSIDNVSRDDYRRFVDILFTQTNQRTKHLKNMADVALIREEQKILAKNFLREKSPVLQKSSMLGPMQEVTSAVKELKKTSPGALATIKNTTKQNISDFKELARPIWYRFFENKKSVMATIQKRLEIITGGKISESQRFKLEERFAEWIKKIKALKAKTGIEFLSEQEYDGLMKQMKYFIDDLNEIKPFVTVNGKKIAFSTQEAYLREAMLKMIRIKPSLTNNIDEVLQTLIRSKMFDDFDWVSLLKNFDGTIENVVDCRAFERAVEFAVYEETNIWKQFNRSFLSKNKELLSPSYYKNRKGMMIENFNDVYAVAQYAKYREYQLNTQIARRLESDYGFSLEQIQTLYRKRYLDSFDLNFAIAKKTMIDKRVQAFESNPLIKELYQPDNVRNSGSYLGQWGKLPPKKVFLQRFYTNLKNETLNFHNSFNEAITKMSRPTFQDVRRAFKEGYHQSKVKSMVYRECANPTSAIRKLSNASMNRFVRNTGAITELTAYTGIHWNEDKTTAEFWTRASFDVAMKVLGNYIRVGVFNSQGKSVPPAVKIGKESAFMAIFAGAIDAPLYTLAENKLWGHGDELLANDNDWEKYISELSQSPELREQPLKPYNELISDENEFYQRYKQIYDQSMAQIDEMLVQNPDIQDENQLYDYLVNQNLIDKLEDDKDTQDELLDWYAKFLADQHVPGELPEDENWLNKALDYHPMMLGGTEVYESQNFSLLPKGMDDETYEGINRWLFYRAWDVTSGAHISYVKNFMIYTLLCKARIHPAWNMHLAKATYVAVTSAETYLKLLLREKTTGK